MSKLEALEDRVTPGSGRRSRTRSTSTNSSPVRPISAGVRGASSCRAERLAHQQRSNARRVRLVLGGTAGTSRTRRPTSGTDAVARGLRLQRSASAWAISWQAPLHGRLDPATAIATPPWIRDFARVARKSSSVSRRGGSVPLRRPSASAIASPSIFSPFIAWLSCQSATAERLLSSSPIPATDLLDRAGATSARSTMTAIGMCTPYEIELAAPGQRADRRREPVVGEARGHGDHRHALPRRGVLDGVHDPAAADADDGVVRLGLQPVGESLRGLQVPA